MGDIKDRGRPGPETPHGEAEAAGPDRLRPETWPTEIGGAPGPEPTRYGDWEHNGRCSDF